MKRRSRNYAKRQLTWMRKLERQLPALEVMNVTGREPAGVAAEIDGLLRSSGRGQSLA